MMSANLHLNDVDLHAEIRTLEGHELLVLDIGARYSDKISLFLTAEQVQAIRRVLERVERHD